MLFRLKPPPLRAVRNQRRIATSLPVPLSRGARRRRRGGRGEGVASAVFGDRAGRLDNYRSSAAPPGGGAPLVTPCTKEANSRFSNSMMARSARQSLRRTPRGAAAI